MGNRTDRRGVRQGPLNLESKQHAATARQVGACDKCRSQKKRVCSVPLFLYRDQVLIDFSAAIYLLLAAIAHHTQSNVGNATE
jgi:hypothetical protein